VRSVTTQPNARLNPEESGHFGGYSILKIVGISSIVRIRKIKRLNPVLRCSSTAMLLTLHSLEYMLASGYDCNIVHRLMSLHLDLGVLLCLVSSTHEGFLVSWKKFPRSKRSLCITESAASRAISSSAIILMFRTCRSSEN